MVETRGIEPKIYVGLIFFLKNFIALEGVRILKREME